MTTQGYGTEEGSCVRLPVRFVFTAHPRRYERIGKRVTIPLHWRRSLRSYPSHYLCMCTAFQEVNPPRRCGVRFAGPGHGLVSALTTCGRSHGHNSVLLRSPETIKSHWFCVILDLRLRCCPFCFDDDGTRHRLLSFYICLLSYMTHSRRGY